MIAIYGKKNDTGPFWDSVLAALDSDGDGRTNGVELQDLPGTWAVGDAAPGNSLLVTLPGDATSFSNVDPVLAAIGAKGVDEGATLAFTISATDADGDAITYSATGLPTGATLTGADFSWTPGFDQAGDHIVTFKVTDAFAAADSEAVTITVANINMPPVLAAIGAKSVDENAALAFTISATDADGDGITYSATGLPTGASLTGANFSWTPSYTQAGEHIVTFKASDGTLEDTEAVTITVANTNRAPVLGAIGPQAGNVRQESTLTLTSTDPDGDALTYSATGMPTGATLTGADFSWTPTTEQEGPDTVTFEVSDGNMTDSEDVIFSINNTPVLASIGAKEVEAGKLLTFPITASDLDGDVLSYSLTDEPVGASLTDTTFSWTPAAGDIGQVLIIFSVSDGKAVHSEIVTVTITEPNAPPVLTAIGPKSVEADAPLTFDIAGTDPNGDSLTYAATDLPSGASFVDSTFAWTPGITQLGDHLVTFGASDGEFEDTEAVTISVLLPTGFPSIDSIGNKRIVVTTLLTFDISATDADGDTITYGALNTPSGATFLDSTFSWTPIVDQVGQYDVTFTAFDGTYTDSLTITITAAPAGAPVLAAISAQSVGALDTLVIAVSATDPDGDSLAYSAKLLPTGASFVDSTFTWIPLPGQLGAYQVRFIAFDGTFADSILVDISVVLPEGAPQFFDPGDQTISANAPYSLTVRATDLDGDALIFSASGLPQGASFMDSVLSWTPTLSQVGIFQVEFVVSDGNFNDTLGVSITVVVPTGQPVLSAIGDTSIAATMELTFTISATDPNGDPLTYSVSGLPAGATFVDSTFTWTPALADTGSHDVVFTVSDGISEDAEIVTIVVITPVAIDVDNRPVAYNLGPNAPNPFNPSTTITFSLPEDVGVSLVIYNLSGQTVRTLVDEYRSAGVHKVVWDARDEMGRPVSTGVYFYRVQAGNFSAVKRMLLLR